jgi:hypothetical protein
MLENCETFFHEDGQILLALGLVGMADTKLLCRRAATAMKLLAKLHACISCIFWPAGSATRVLGLFV